MHISDSFLPYEARTLILVCDRSHAKMYLAHDRAFDFVVEYKNDRLEIGDNERYASGDGMRQFTAHDEDLKKREAHHFYQDLAKALFDHKQKHEFSKLILVVPNEDKNDFTQALHTEVRELLDRTISKQLTKLSEDRLIEAIDADRQA